VRQGLFIAGTDTGVGKTRVAVALLAALAAQGLRTVGMKPVAAGARRVGGRLRNDDALQLIAQATVPAAYEDVNPYCLEAALSPHIAAVRAGLTIRLEHIAGACTRLAALAEFVVVEGAGGWLTPIGPRQTMADVAAACAFPVLLVVGLRLGCLNHALLTAEAVAAHGGRLAGWIASAIDSHFEAVDDNLATLAERLPAPQLGLLPHSPSAAADAVHLAHLAQILGDGVRAAPRALSP
jgi:dethiobiotin synthetase